LNPRKPIIAMLVVGIAIVAGLTFVPYSMVERARDAVSAVITQPPQVAAPVLPAPTPTPPAFDAEAWYVGRGEEPGRHGVLIETFDGTRVLAAHNPDAAFNPASLIKLATTLVALRQLGAGYRFETRVYTEGEVGDDGTLRGKVTVAGGDPTFGDISAALIAKELRARGIKRITDELAVTPEFCFNYSESPVESAERMSRVMQMKEKQRTLAETQPPSHVKPLFVLRSYPLRNVLLYMNAHSSNFVAERVGALVGGPEGIKRFLVEELKLPASQVEIARASGREHNRMTARGLLTVLRALESEATKQGLKLDDLMPVVSDDAGTLRRRLIGSPLEGAAVGKTGTLTAEVDGGMASLAGVVYTESSGMIAFVILDQGNQIAENRQLEDELLSEVVVNNAVPRPIATPDKPRPLLPADTLTITSE
jgi:D-alanyl-D-alanine carboxypeptidase/D-alanyl-D-alanine-endopeptidase (penicillin-binding protein 4)